MAKKKEQEPQSESAVIIEQVSQINQTIQAQGSSNRTRHNAVINRVDSQLSVYCGDASLLDSKTADYDLVLANINRNILLNDMPRFCQIMKQDAKLILSGFYTEDIPLLEARGKELGLTLTGAKNRDKWASIIMQRVNNA